MANGCDTQTIEAHERRAVYTNALHKSLEIFISYTEKTIDDVMSNGLRPVADAAMYISKQGGRDRYTFESR